MVERGVESVQEKSDGKGNLQELAAIIASSATAAAIAASQRHAGRVSSTLSLRLAYHEVFHIQSIYTTPTPRGAAMHRVVHRDLVS